MAGTFESPTRAKKARSVSQLKSYLHCGWQYRLTRIYKVPEAPSVWLAAGKAFHSATEDFDRASWQDTDLSQFDPADFQTAFGVWFDQYLDETRQEHPDVADVHFRTAGRKTKDKPAGEDIDWWRQEGPVMVGRYIEWRTSTVDSLRIAAVESGPGIEVEVTGSLGGVPVRGYVDRLLEDANTGDLMIADMKTGSRKVDDPTQLATYALLLERRLQRPIVWGAYYNGRTGTLDDPFDLTAYTDGALGTVYRNLDRAIDQAIYLPNISSGCKACGVRKHCVFQGGTDPAA